MEKVSFSTDFSSAHALEKISFSSCPKDKKKLVTIWMFNYLFTLFQAKLETNQKNFDMVVTFTCTSPAKLEILFTTLNPLTCSPLSDHPWHKKIITDRPDSKCCDIESNHWSKCIFNVTDCKYHNQRLPLCFYVCLFFILIFAIWKLISCDAAHALSNSSIVFGVHTYGTINCHSTS